MYEVTPALAFLILAVGIAIVLGMIVVLRVNAFIALITAAMVVSLLAPGELAEKIERVAKAFGSTAGNIGIVIALAAVIGKCMMDSGAADRVVRTALALFGEKRASIALSTSGFALSIPVFFDTAFYLLVPLARSTYRQTKTHYLKYLMAIAAGGVATHTLVPPTPGPLFIATQLGVDIGMMMLVGICVGVPAVAVALLYGRWLDSRMPVTMRPLVDTDEPATPLADEQLPSLAWSLAPILLPIVLITANSAVKVVAFRAVENDPAILSDEVSEKYLFDGVLRVEEQSGDGATTRRVLADGEISEVLRDAANEGLPIAGLFGWTNVLGNPNLALLFSAAVSIWTLARQRRSTRSELGRAVETALMSGGVIILITAAGGAFGEMLKELNIGRAMQDVFGDPIESGLPLLLFAFGLASLMKFAQGSSTAAMIVTSGIVAAMITSESLPFHPVYLATSIGAGSLVGSWMNDSGFWIFTKMGGLTELESLKSWTPLLAIVGIVSMIMTVILAVVLPMS